MRKYNFDKDEIRSTAWIEDGQDGLGCEITQISADNTNWWSFGFEGFGSTNNKNEFEKAIASVLLDFPLTLERHNSYGYPYWFKKNFRKKSKLSK